MQMQLPEERELRLLVLANPFFFSIQDTEAGGPHGFWLVNVLVMKVFALQSPVTASKRLYLGLLFLVKML